MQANHHLSACVIGVPAWRCIVDRIFVQSVHEPKERLMPACRALDHVRAVQRAGYNTREHLRVQLTHSCPEDVVAPPAEDAVAPQAFASTDRRKGPSSLNSSTKVHAISSDPSGCPLQSKSYISWPRLSRSRAPCLYEASYNLDKCRDRDMSICQFKTFNYAS